MPSPTYIVLLISIFRLQLSLEHQRRGSLSLPDMND
jgi:hypothetical protein